MMPQTEEALFYQLYFQQPGIAEAELERDPRATLRTLLYSASGDAEHGAWAADGPVGMVPRKGGLLSGMTNPSSLPEWLTENESTSMPGRSPRPDFAAGSTGIATSTATGNSWRLSPGRG